MERDSALFPVLIDCIVLNIFVRNDNSVVKQSLSEQVLVGLHFRAQGIPCAASVPDLVQDAVGASPAEICKGRQNILFGITGLLGGKMRAVDDIAQAGGVNIADRDHDG